MKKYNKYKDSGIEWIGEIPEHWKVLKLKMELDFLNNKRIPLEAEARSNKKGDYPYYGASGIIDYIDDYIFDGTYILIGEDGANILSRSTPLAFIADGKFWVNNHAHILDSKNGNIKYFCEQLELIDYSVVASGSAQPKLTKEAIANLKILIPPLPEQTTIATYLDRKTAQIDDLISKKEKLIELLKEERTAMINQAVTKGLDPNVPMKDSGVEWLGEIPDGWEVKKLKYLTSKIGDGLHGTPNYVDYSEYFFINGNNICDGKINLKENTKCVSENEYLANKKILNSSTILMSINGTIGSLAIYSNELVMLGKSVAYINCTEDVCKEFIFHYLDSEVAKNFINGELSGSTIKNLSLFTINNIPVPFPCIIEQNEIVTFINVEQNRLNEIISKTNKEIDLLKEYKTALISEVVTGKVKVIED
ncbi:MAG: restriction endonuclease subunit S [Bacteroidales bacterium]|nr:restriction endonuclease subunit S [Bacteroidales bacterium]